LPLGGRHDLWESFEECLHGEGHDLKPGRLWFGLVMHSSPECHVLFQFLVVDGPGRAIHHHQLFKFVLLKNQRFCELVATPGEGFLDKIP
jgi:hypothetical protein